MSRRVEVLKLYRQFLRAVNHINNETFTAKLKFNVRDAFEVYAGEKDPTKIDEMISRAKADLRTFQMLSKWDRDVWAFGVPPRWEKTTPLP